ncbi:cytochrome ubiquinol oxidase subunit I [Thiotrichales bacterium 19X7-9]|nr:cytochrome ubiquinol oxidase subunit I [Thiotrichales bacterium 19X7-9]
MSFIPLTEVVDLSRVQFAFTAMYHFIFVPLTLGLAWLLVIMETKYLTTGKPIYKSMTQFWGKLLGINFALGVVSGMTMEFEFGQNWSYFSRFIGGSFGPILAIEGITAFMLEATMIGLFFFGWDKLSRKMHWFVTLLLAIGSSLSIVNILAANSWMRHPIFTNFDIAHMNLGLTSLAGLYLSELAQISVGHVAFAAFTLASMFVIGISAFYLKHNQHREFAIKSMSIAAGFGFICVLAVGFYGDQNGLEVAKDQPEKMAAIEAQWETQKPPASWYMVGIPHQQQEDNSYVLSIPYALSLIADHNLTGTVEGLKPIMASYYQPIKSGYVALEKLIKIRSGKATKEDEAIFEANKENLGFGFLYHSVNGMDAKLTHKGIVKTQKASIPEVWISFWSFRLMLGMWGIMLLVLLFAVIRIYYHKIQFKKYMLWIFMLVIPAPYIAVECGWILCENGRQPWMVYKIIPTGIGSSNHYVSTLIITICGFALIYATLFILELFLMFKYARLGPGKYIAENAK